MKKKIFLILPIIVLMITIIIITVIDKNMPTNNLMIAVCELILLLILKTIDPNSAATVKVKKYCFISDIKLLPS